MEKHHRCPDNQLHNHRIIRILSLQRYICKGRILFFVIFLVKIHKNIIHFVKDVLKYTVEVDFFQKEEKRYGEN